MSKSSRKKSKKGEDHEPRIENRRARYDYAIGDTLECGVKLVGTEVKAIRNGHVSLNEGYVRATDEPPRLTLHGVHVGEYPPAGPARQHEAVRVRQLLAHKREIRKLAQATREKGTTIVPLKLYFSRGRIKLLVGIGRGKSRVDKRQDIAKKEAKREIERALSRRR